MRKASRLRAALVIPAGDPGVRGWREGLRATVASAVAQTEPELEVQLLAADADAVTYALGELGGSPRVAILVEDEGLAAGEPERGPFQALARRVTETPARFVKILWPGEVLEPECVARERAWLESHPSHAAVFSAPEEPAAVDRGQGAFAAPAGAAAAAGSRAPGVQPTAAARTDVLLCDLLTCDLFTAGRALLRTECIALVGGIDPSFSVRPELDVWLRLAARFEVGLLDECLARGAPVHLAATDPALVRGERARSVALALARSGPGPWLRTLGARDPDDARAQAAARIELARRLLGADLPALRPQVRALLREARVLGAELPAAQLPADLVALLRDLVRPGLLSSGGASPWRVPSRSTGIVDRAPVDAPLPAPAPARPAAERPAVVAAVRVGMAIATADELARAMSVLEHAGALRQAAGMEVVALCGRALARQGEALRAPGARVEVLESDADPGEIGALAERLRLTAVLAHPGGPGAALAAAAGVPVLDATALAPANEEPPVELAGRIGRAIATAVATWAGREERELVGLADQLAGELVARRLLGDARRALERASHDRRTAHESAQLRAAARGSLRELDREATMVRVLAERARDASGRALDKLRIKHRLGGAWRALRARAGRRDPSAPRVVSLDEPSANRFLDAAASEPGALLWVVYTTDPFSETRGQRSTWIARECLRRGHRVVFFYWRWRLDEPIPPAPHERLLPVPIDQFYRLQRRLIALDGAGLRKILLIEFPDAFLFEQVDLFNASGFVTVYDCVDDWAEFARAGQAHWYDEAVERSMVVHADVAAATHPTLAARLERLRGRPVVVIPNACDPTAWGSREGAPARASVKPTAEGESAPIVGYFGHLSPAWFDWALVRESAARHPAWAFELIGHGAPDGLELPPNVRLVGPVEHGRLAEWARRWSVAVIPFCEGRLSEVVDPVKLYEYLALGLPVVAVGMPHLGDVPGVRACGRDGFDIALAEALAEPLDADRVRAFLEASTWERRVEALLEQVLGEEASSDVLKALAG